MMTPVVPGSTDQSVHIRIIDSADGTPETGVTSATSGLALSYRVGATGTTTALTESDLAGEGSAHSDGGMKHIGNGIYRVDVPDAAVPGSEGVVTWVFGGATDMVVIPAAIVGRVVPLAPTVAGRALDVSAGGEAGLDWANVGTPGATVNLSATNIDTDQVVASVTGAVGSVTGAVGSVTGAVGSVTGAVASVTGNVGGNVTGSVGSVAAGGITAASIATGAIDADALAAEGANKIADHTLRRSWATAAASADGDAKSFRSLLGAVAKLVNRFAVVAATATVYEADDTTALGTQTATTDADADHITALNTD